MENLVVVLTSVIFYMTGIFTGMGFCFKYKNYILRSKSQEQLSDLIKHFNSDPNILTTTSMGQPVIPIVPSAHPPTASPVPHTQLKEIVIRSVD